jgi:hypothetical protein
MYVVQRRKLVRYCGLRGGTESVLYIKHVCMWAVQETVCRIFASVAFTRFASVSLLAVALHSKCSFV